MNPQKEIIDQFEQLKLKFAKFSDQWKSNSKLNVKSLIKKEYELTLNQLMNFYNELIQKKENIGLILKANLDLKCWNILTERISLVIKYPIDPKHLGKNYQIIIQNLYSTLLDDLRNSYDFFKNVYTITTNYETEQELPIFISNVLTFMGDIKKLKLIFNKKFEEFKDIIAIEGDNKKDANDSIRFFNYALNNNPRNTRVYSNLGYVYREFLEDHMSSAYWFIRALSCIDNDMKKIRDNLEKDFNYIRKRLQKIDYIVDSNINNISFLRYDIDYLPTLYYRIIGILFMNIDIDEMEHLLTNFSIIISRILLNYKILPDQFKINYEVNGYCAQMIILAIFGIHYNINNLQNYPDKPKKIILNKEKKNLLSFDIYSHDLVATLNKENIKPIVKQTINFIILFTRVICKNITEQNFPFVEKYLLILFYWLSLNYDMFNLIIDDEMKKYLQFLNFSLQSDPEMKKFFMPQTQVTLNIIVNKINNLILPIELTFLGFIPMHRFFELNKKIGIFRIEKIEEITLINKMILIHFLDSFGLYAKPDIQISNQFYNRMTLNVQETYIPIQNQMDPSMMQLKERLTNNMIKLPTAATLKKEKPLIILDASNVAMRHGGQTYSTKGIKIVMDYFTKNGHQVISFLPEYLFRQKDPNNPLNKKRVQPDNIEYLNDLYKKHLVIQSPPQDYDDSYCIQHAKNHNAFIVTNDLFRDYLEHITDNRKRETERIWIKERCISFTFNKDEFIPNPDAAFFREFNITEYNKNKEI